MQAAEISAVRKRYSSDLSAHDWQQLEPLLVVRRRGKWPLWEVVNAIFYVLKNGCVWRDLPGDLPPWGTVYWYFAKWEVDGTWQRVNTCLNVSSREWAEKKPGPRPSSSTRKA
ncbi:transposase [Hymenobacter psychrophilus]|uniref:transposase n=1 Tax=Hymenobacter psychrophilus TaxID=651662 RepID=UPI000B86B64E|nr:transposase [Hymenobacter psychrophilus]